MVGRSESNSFVLYITKDTIQSFTKQYKDSK